MWMGPVGRLEAVGYDRYVDQLTGTKHLPRTQFEVVKQGANQIEGD